MHTIMLYKYFREDGGITVSPQKPDGDYVELVRLIADENKLLTNGDIETTCIDVSSADGWWEIDAPIEEGDKTPDDAIV